MTRCVSTCYLGLQRYGNIYAPQYIKDHFLKFVYSSPKAQHDGIGDGTFEKQLGFDEVMRQGLWSDGISNHTRKDTRTCSLSSPTDNEVVM